MIKIYSHTSLAFLNTSRHRAREILSQEMHVSLGRTRFEVAGSTWPLELAVFEHPRHLGQFSVDTLTIALNKSLMLTAGEALIKDILRHELAHYMMHILYGDRVASHGHEFRAFCQEQGWRPQVAQASFDLSQQDLYYQGNLHSDRLLSKIKKLLALSSSSNPHEAELATAKANQLLLKHHLSQAELEDEMVMAPLYEVKRLNSKLQCFYAIIKNFLVRPVISYTREGVVLEALGNRENISVAQYMISFLDHEFDRLWQQEQKESQLKGLRAKNSFFRGLSHGFCHKTGQVKEQFKDEEQKALIVVNRQLEQLFTTIYPHTHAHHSGSLVDEDSFYQGEKRGRELSIHPGIKDQPASTLALPGS